MLPNFHGVREELKKVPKASHLERVSFRVADFETSDVVHESFSQLFLVSHQTRPTAPDADWPRGEYLKNRKLTEVRGGSNHIRLWDKPIE